MTLNTISILGEHILEAREGIRLRAYFDTKRILTVGVGHVVLPEDGLRLHDAITQDQCDTFLAKDLLTCENAINKSVQCELQQNQFDALVSFVFNIGVPHFETSTLLRKLNAGAGFTIGQVAQEFDKWHVPSEITGRRNSEKKQFLTPYTIQHS